MRITGGKLKGRIIKCPDGVIRPAMDRMRESVFSIIGELDGKSWLDLFSGSGTIAIEAVSRGSKDVELCEKDKIKVGTVLENVSVTEKDQLAKLRFYIDQAVPLNVLYEGKTPLMYAAKYGNSTKIIKMLIDNQASPVLRSTEGKTAFDYASKNSNLIHDDSYWALNVK